MSLELAGAIPVVEFKTHDEKIVHIFNQDKNIDIEIPMDEFLIAAHYVLTNTNLGKKDPRIEFVKIVKKLKIGKGYMHTFNPNTKRLL